MVNDEQAVGVDSVRVVFDDERAVSDAGVTLVATLVERLGLEALAGRVVRLRRDRPGAAGLPVIDVHGYLPRALKLLEIGCGPLHEYHLLSTWKWVP